MILVSWLVCATYTRLNRREFRAILLARDGINKVEHVHDSVTYMYRICCMSASCETTVRRAETDSGIDY